jgi:hypothetical protein
MGTCTSARGETAKRLCKRWLVTATNHLPYFATVVRAAHATPEWLVFHRFLARSMICGADARESCGDSVATTAIMMWP